MNVTAFKWQHVLEMGGYGSYVWPCYAVSFLALVIIVYLVKRAENRAKKQLSLLEKTYES